MNRKSFVDLTALLDVVLILFFAVLINMANSADVIKEKNVEVLEQITEEKEKTEEMEQALEKALNELELTENELASLYGTKAENLDAYQEIISRISKIDIMLAGQSNELWINGKDTKINIVRERLETPRREEILKKEISTAINLAIARREKSDFIFLRVTVKDIDVYKYAYDYLVEIIDEIVLEYGEDKVMISREFE